ncbi:hypothetical protein pEaSNUABM34_00066 [Erwinia phage pEa_SNUABM_34]|nr:hypothetical protein pEaSNUABM34_00066 [Erwinia phage pEa_SNUABM_34]
MQLAFPRKSDDHVSLMRRSLSRLYFFDDAAPKESMKAGHLNWLQNLPMCKAMGVGRTDNVVSTGQLQGQGDNNRWYVATGGYVGTADAYNFINMTYASFGQTDVVSDTTTPVSNPTTQAEVIGSTLLPSNRLMTACQYSGTIYVGNNSGGTVGLTVSEITRWPSGGVHYNDTYTQKLRSYRFWVANNALTSVSGVDGTASSVAANGTYQVSSSTSAPFFAFVSAYYTLVRLSYNASGEASGGGGTFDYNGVYSSFSRNRTAQPIYMPRTAAKAAVNITWAGIFVKYQQAESYLLLDSADILNVSTTEPGQYAQIQIADIEPLLAQWSPARQIML